MLDFIADEQIAGAKVLRAFSRFDKDGKMVWFKRGDTLTREELLGFNPTNRHALIEANYVVVRYGAVPGGERFMIKEKDGFSVIEGRKVNDKPLEREQALALLNE